MKRRKEYIGTVSYATCGVLGGSEVFDRCMITSPLQPIINKMIVSITATFRGAFKASITTSTAEHQYSIYRLPLVLIINHHQQNHIL